jgi:hypothetical protein
MLHAWINGMDMVTSLKETYHTKVGILKWPL